MTVLSPAPLAIAVLRCQRIERTNRLVDGCPRIQSGFAASWLAGREYRDAADNGHFADGLRETVIGAQSSWQD